MNCDRNSVGIADDFSIVWHSILLLKKTFTVADNEIISRMIERMKKLVNSHSVQRAFCSNFNDVNEVMNLVELRVVREFNLPDTYASVLQVIHVYNFSWLSLHQSVTKNQWQITVFVYFFTLWIEKEQLSWIFLMNSVVTRESYILGITPSSCNS